MKFKKVGIATARITGLKEEPFYHNALCFWACHIHFEDSSTLFFNQLPVLCAGKTEEEAKEYCEMLKHNFVDKAGIYDGDTVAIIYDVKKSDIYAISALGQNTWVDVKDKFAVKKFNELNLVFTSLEVH